MEGLKGWYLPGSEPRPTSNGLARRGIVSDRDKLGYYKCRVTFCEDGISMEGTI